MKKYWIAFALVIVICVGGFGTIMFKCFIQGPVPQVVYLNLDSMHEAGPRILNPADMPSTISIYPCNETNVDNNEISWADAYVCRSYSKEDSLSGDTALLLLDVHTGKDQPVITSESEFAASIKPAPHLNKCRIMIPANEINRVKKYRYKLGRVILVDKEMYD